VKITSAGIIRNEDQPRVGITSRASHDLIDEAITQGIDLGYESALAEFLEFHKLAGVEATEEKQQEWIDDFQSEGPYLIGDWIKNAEGLYEIDRNGAQGFSASFSSGSFGDIVTVEWSKAVKRCQHTSPCFVMADGSGPCGDLDTPGDSVLAFALPDDCMQTEED